MFNLWCHHERGRPRELFREIGDRLSEGRATVNLGTIFFDLGRLGEAKERWEQARELFREIGARLGEAIALDCLGLGSLRLGRLAEARAYLEGALDLTRETGDRRIEGYALEGLGQVLEAAGETREAGRRYEEALKLRREINYAKGVAETLVALGQLRAAQGEQDAARTHLDEAIAMARELKTPGVEVLASCHKALLPDGDADAALAAFSEHEARISPEIKTQARSCLWKATTDHAHLEEAHRLLMDAREHAPQEYRDTMLQNVPLHRDIMKAWEEHGEKR